MTTSTAAAPATTDGSGDAGATTGPPATTAEPSSISFTYTCGDGSTGTGDAPTGDIEQLDDLVNTYDLCELKGGLARIDVVAPCPSGDRPVSVEASDGALPDIATLDLCENP